MTPSTGAIAARPGPPRRGTLHLALTLGSGAVLTGLLLACGGGGDPAVPTAEAGERIAATLGCATCHSPDGARRLGPTWQGIWGQDVPLEDGSSVLVDATYIATSIREPAAQIVAGYSPLMPRLDVSDAEVAALTAYIESLGR